MSGCVQNIESVFPWGDWKCRTGIKRTKNAAVENVGMTHSNLLLTPVMTTTTTSTPHPQNPHTGRPHQQPYYLVFAFRHSYIFQACIFGAPFFHDFPELFNRVVIVQVRFLYTFTKCGYGVWGALKLSQRLWAEPGHQRVTLYNASRYRANGLLTPTLTL